MNDLTPYEQELAKHLNDLPLPDEDRAWQDMKELLDKDDDKGGGKKPPSDTAIWGIALLILLLTIGVLWYAHSKKQSIINEEENNNTRTIKKDPATETETTATKGTQKISLANTITKNNATHNNEPKNDNGISTENTSADENNINPVNHGSSGNKNRTGKFSTGYIQSNNNNTSLNEDVVADNNNSKTGNHFARRTKFLKINNKKRRIKNILPLSNDNAVSENATPEKTKLLLNETKPGYNTINETSGNNNSSSSSKNKNSLHVSSSKGPHVKARKNYLNNNEPTNEDITTGANPKAHKKATLVVNKAKNPNFHVKHFGAKGDETTSIASATTDDGYQKQVRDTSTLQHIAPKQTIADTSLVNRLTTIKKASDSTKSDTTKKDKKEDKKKNKPYFAAGIAAQQSIDKPCNCAYPDNLNPPATVKDYIPSVYLGYYTKKWFLQSEFKYAAPQYVNGFTYRVMENMPVVLNDTITTFTIKKIYGHQGSVSFNYCILPNLSIGTGLIYNIFSGADIQKTIQKKSLGPADSLISSTMITDKDDTGFSGLGKSNIQLLLQAQYQWKRFSVGASYAIGLTSYIKYADPYSNIPGEKKNNSLNVFLRYELWKQK